MRKIRALIVDDEINARSLLQHLLGEHCPEVTVVACAEDVRTAVKWINKQPVDMVFLDVEMPNENGFALFDYFNKPTFETVFCTAYSQYAIKAFEVSAVDYVLKPIGISKLKEAVKKVAERLDRVQPPHQIEVLKENLSGSQIRKIGVHIGDGIVFMDLDDIHYFEADGSYTTIHHTGGRDLAVKKIKHFEDLLANDNRFFRIHRSYLVNITQIKKYSKKEGFSVTYDGKNLLPVSREKKEEFENFMQRNNFIS
ncbi:DNA-binding response regulator [Flavobacterium magnum]|uniref:DNA-binding response regulator n=1 Tax=Flavobacterium magnum TaxID=2162713 RepID=A0A2S0RGK1_9FLAO|nr:LytTR family DNA-binding domain-containing protein [Flavobacterium magnum]AWA30231.1 DNA-binding response regulator [Flavobacterium magnum]